MSSSEVTQGQDYHPLSIQILSAPWRLTLERCLFQEASLFIPALELGHTDRSFFISTVCPNCLSPLRRGDNWVFQTRQGREAGGSHLSQCPRQGLGGSPGLT